MIEEKFDTIYSIDITVYDAGGHSLGVHKLDYNGTEDGITDDELGALRVRLQSVGSLKRWLQAYKIPKGLYSFDVGISRHDGFGEEWLDSDEAEAEWEPEKDLLKFYL